MEVIWIKIEVFGSTGCAKCDKLKEDIEGIIEEKNLSDVSVEKVEDISELAERGIMSTPAVAVDGEIKFKGRIPGKKEIIEAITDA